MNEKIPANQRGQSLVLVAVAMVALVGFVALAVDLGNAYYARRTAQNAADGAALAGVSVMATGINKNNPKLDDDVMDEMDEFAELNGVAYVDADNDGMNDSVDGFYVDGAGNRLEPEKYSWVGLQGGDDVPKEALGVEAITYITATSFFGGIFGFDGYPVQARAVALVRNACGSDCVVPIVTSKETLFGPSGNKPKLGACFNIWSESYDDKEDDDPVQPGSYGWISWSWQQMACKVEPRPCPPTQQGTGCSSATLGENLDPINCGTGYVEIEDWVANTTGVKNADAAVRCALDYYLGIEHTESECPENTLNLGLGPIPFTIVVYDDTNLETPSDNAAACGGIETPNDEAYIRALLDNPYDNAWGLLYHVAGFAQMQILGYELSQGGTNVSAQINDIDNYLAGLYWGEPDLDPDPLVFPNIDLSDGFDPMVDCWNPPEAQQLGNRITAYFMDWVTSYSSDSECFDPWGTLLASPRLIE